MLPPEVEDWILMIPPCCKVWRRVRLQQWVFACLSITTVLFSTACPGHFQATPESSNVPVEELERLVTDSASKNKEAEQLEFAPDLLVVHRF